MAFLIFARRSMLGVAFLATASVSPAQANSGWPAEVRASYDITFAGVNVGSFDFKSTQKGTTYDLHGQAKLSLLFGAFKWSGDTRANGAMVGGSTKPQAFAFNFNSSKKSGSTKMSFTNDTVSSVLHDPPKDPKEGTLPVLPIHLKSVLDPLTAIMAVSKGSSENPCSRRIPIYDGKARFDLLLSPRGVVQLAERTPSGQPGTGYVCRVKYVPIAGHKPDQETKYMSSSDGIEITLRPIPSANIFVPYKVTIPTVAGSAVLTSKRVDIITATQQQIALSH